MKIYNLNKLFKFILLIIGNQTQNLTYTYASSAFLRGSKDE